MNLIEPDPLYLDHATRDDRLDRRSERGREYRALLAEHQRTVQHLGFVVMCVIPMIVGLAWALTDARDRLLELETQLALTTATLAARDAVDAQWDCRTPITFRGDLKTCIRVKPKAKQS